MDWGGFLWVLEAAGGREQGEELPLVCICCSSSCTDSKAPLIVRWIVGQELQLCFGMLVFSPVLFTSGRQEKWGGCRAARNNNRNICQLIHHTLQHHLPFTFPVLRSHCTIQISNCFWMQQKKWEDVGLKKGPINNRTMLSNFLCSSLDVTSPVNLVTISQYSFQAHICTTPSQAISPHLLGYLERTTSTGTGWAPSQKICGRKLRMESPLNYSLTLSSVFSRIHKHGQREMRFQV